MNAYGKVIKYGDNVDTDVIIPARYLTTTDIKELVSHCMEDLDPDFTNKVEEGDMIVAGKNFGSGSSREQAPIVIKGSGISVVIAKSFARIFYRNAINIGLSIIECPECVDEIDEGDKLSVNFSEGKLHNETKNKTYTVAPFPPFIQNIIQNGGLIKSIENKAFGG